MRKLYLSAVCAAVLASPVVAWAQTGDQAATSTLSGFDDRWYLLPFAAYTWADENRHTSDNVGWGFAVGKGINQWLNLELRVTYTDLPSNGKVEDVPQGEFTVGDVGIDALYVFNRAGTIQPFLLGGIGAIDDKFDCDNITANWTAPTSCHSGNAWSFMAEAGAGVMFRVAEYASVRIDGRYRYDQNNDSLRDDDSFGDWVATAGLVIPIGGKAPVKTTRTYEMSADTLFAFNKYNLSSQGVSTINNFTRDLDHVTYDGVRVAGHTDPIGSVAYNQELSERRAGTVKDQLVNQGVPAGKVSAAGYGKSNLKVTEAECAHAKGREALIACLQPNRRVEVTVEGMTEKK